MDMLLPCYCLAAAIHKQSMYLEAKPYESGDLYDVFTECGVA